MNKALLLFMLCPILSIAQITVPETTTNKRGEDPSQKKPIEKHFSNNYDTLTKIENGTKITRIALKQTANNKLINKYLGKVVGTTNKADQLGNYASFDPALGSLAFKGTIPIGHEESTRFSYLGIGINGDLVSNGIAALFNNSKLNTNIGIQLDYNFRLWKSTMRRDAGEMETYENKISLLNQSTIRKLLNLPDSTQIHIDYTSNLKDLAHLKIEVKFYETEVKNTKKTFDSLNLERLNTMNKLQSLDSLNNVYLKMHSNEKLEGVKSAYDKEISLNNHTIKILKKQLNDNEKNYSDADLNYKQQIAKLKDRKKNYDTIEQKTDSLSILIKTLKSQLNELRNKTIQARNKIEDSLFNKLELRALKMDYLTVITNASQKEYYTFNKKLAYGSQLDKKSFTTYKIGLAWNKYNANFVTNRYFFYRLVGAYIRDNNTDLLSTTALSQEAVFKNADGDTTRKVTKTYNVYTDPLTSTRKWNFGGDFYFLFGKRTSGFHVSASYFKPEKHKNYTDVSAGYLISFQSIKKDDPLINVEVYYKFADIYNNRGTGIEFWQRNEIGFKVGLPFALLKK